MLTWISLLISIYLVYDHYGHVIQYIAGVAWKIARCIAAKRRFPHVPANSTTTTTMEPWDEPPETLSHARIIWAYWHSGEKSLPGFCQLSLESWRVRNPNWKIIVLDESNFREYVSIHDLPNTFESLKVQHQSDVVRLAVLRRYGGLYLDASYICLRSFDNMWEQALLNNDMYLTGLVTMTDGMIFPNNCFLLCPRPQNPLIISWQQSVLRFLEQPGTNLQEMREHSVLSRVSNHFDDPNLGVFSTLLPYFGVIWALAQSLYYDPSIASYVKKHVWILPTYKWTMDFMMVELTTMTEKEANTTVSRCEDWHVWLFKRIPMALRLVFQLDPNMANRMLRTANMFKCSSDFCFDFEKPPQFHTSVQSTLGMIYKSSIDLTMLPNEQADTDGAYRITPFV